MKLDLTVAEHRFVVDILPENWRMDEMFSNYTPFMTGGGEGNPAPAVFSLQVDLHPQWHRNDGFKPVYVGQVEPEEPRLDLYCNETGEWWVEMAPLGDMPPVAALLMSPDFSRGHLSVASRRFGRFATDNAAMLMFAFCTSCRNTIEMHASVIRKEGKAYMFIARSGTGKSTHSRMWLENIQGSELLNDDNPVLRVFDDGTIKVFGTPWSGKTPCYRNESALAGGIVLIRRCSENRITRFSPVEAYASVSSSTSGFRPVASMADGLHDTIARTVMNVPCYVLDCRPDAQAAEVCYAGVCRN